MQVSWGKRFLSVSFTLFFYYLEQCLKHGRYSKNICWIFSVCSLSSRCLQLYLPPIYWIYIILLFFKNNRNSNYLLWNGLALKLHNSKFLLKITVLNGESNLFICFNDKGQSLHRYCMPGMHSLRRAVEYDVSLTSANRQR